LGRVLLAQRGSEMTGVLVIQGLGFDDLLC
jgi:hypothetical protein